MDKPKKQKPSVNHHYIPIFYLGGFTNEFGQYYVHDKKTGKTFQSIPRHTFFEKHRNTGSIVHQVTGELEQSVLPEDMVTHYDNTAAAVIKALRTTNPGDNALTPEALYELMMFIHSIFWRTPANDDLRKHIIEQSSFKDLGFGIFDKQGNRSVKTEEMMKDIDLFKKIYPVLLPVTSFLNDNYTANWKDWKLYYHTKDMHVISDNPVIYKEMNNFSGLQHNIIFPVSSRIYLVSSPHHPEKVADIFPHMADLYLFSSAKRFVAYKDKLYLNYLEKVNATTVKEHGIEKLKKSLFSYFKPSI